MWVYFARRGRGFVKIGRSWRPDLRVRALAAKHPDIRLLGAVPSSAYGEMYAHEAQKRHRLVGEWYWPRPALLAFIEETTRRGRMPGFERWLHAKHEAA